jgi:hypothetical protein
MAHNAARRDGSIAGATAPAHAELKAAGRISPAHRIAWEEIADDPAAASRNKVAA